MEDMMKLIELVTKSLEIIGGGWPENVVAMSQGYDMGIRAYVFHDNVMQLRQDYLTKASLLAIDFDTALVTREQYEAALAASQKVEWDGNYPIKPGTDVDVHFDGDDCRVWTTFRVEYMRGDVVVLHDYRTDDVGAYSNLILNFRPIRSEADKKRDDAVSAMVKFDLDRRTVGIDALYPALYNAIAEGKIPGVRIE